MEQEKYKTIFFKTLSAVIVVLTLTIAYCVFFGPAKKYVDSLWPSKTISVSAEGKVAVSPDVAKLSFSVVSEGANPETIADENNKKISNAINFIKSLGVEEKDIKTTQYNLYPRYEYDEDRRTSFISGFVLNQSVLIKVRDFDDAAKILAGLPELGINQIGSIVFEIEDDEKYLVEARKKAFEKAKEKAESMAALNGVKIGKVLTFGEYQNFPQPVFFGKGGEDADFGPIAPPTIEPGMEEVTVQVTVTYELK